MKKGKRIFFSIKYKLLIFYVFILAAVLILSGSLIDNRYQESFARSEWELSRQMINRVAGALNQLIWDIDQFSMTVAYHQTIQSLVTDYRENRFIGTRAETRLVQQLFGTEWNSSRNILYLHISDNQGHNVLACGTMLQREEQRDDLFRTQAGRGTAWHYYPALTAYTHPDAVFSILSFYRAMVNPDTYEVIGLVCFDIPIDSMVSRMMGYDVIDGVVLSLADQHGSLIYQTKSAIQPGAPALSVTLSNQWRLSAYLPQPVGGSQAASIRAYQWTIIVICAVFAILLAALLSHFIFRPLRTLILAMEQIKEGNLDIRVPYVSRDELSVLSNAFNDMIEHMQRLMEKNIAIEKIERQTEVKYLQAQINPHFLYNTLDSIRWQARREHSPIIEESVQALSNMFRHYLNIGNDFVLLREELVHAGYYVKLMQFRYGERIRYEVDVPEKMEECLILKMLLQPLLENAFAHGLTAQEEGGVIRVSSRREGDFFSICVADDGKGIDIAQVTELIQEPASGERGFALKNIHERLRLHFGQAASLTFSHNGSGGTCVTLRMPWRTGDF